MDDKYSSENHEIITEKTVSTQNEGAGTEGFEPEKSPTHKSNGEITPIVISNYSNGIIDGEQQAYEQPNTENNVKEARRAVSRNGINLSVFLISASIASVLTMVIAASALFILNKILGNINGGGEIMAQVRELLDSPEFLSLMSGFNNIFCMYIVAFPIFCIMQMGIERRKYKKGGIGAGEFLIMIPISQFLMIIGSYIGEHINSILSSLMHLNIQNSTIDSITKMPLWLMTIMACVLAPIVEEFMFRRTLIGTLGKYGNVFAIIISSVAFGLFHGNFYQFFYAFLVGLILGYIYVKGGNLWLCILMHAIINFLGGVLPKLAEDSMIRYEELLSLYTAGEKVNAFEMMLNQATISTYNALSLVLFVSGIVLTVIAIAKKWYKIDNNPEIELPEKSIGRVVFLNAGSIIFLIFSAITISLSIFVT